MIFSSEIISKTRPYVALGDFFQSVYGTENPPLVDVYNPILPRRLLVTLAPGTYMGPVDAYENLDWCTIVEVRGYLMKIWTSVDGGTVCAKRVPRSNIPTEIWTEYFHPGIFGWTFCDWCWKRQYIPYLVGQCVHCGLEHILCASCRQRQRYAGPPWWPDARTRAKAKLDLALRPTGLPDEATQRIAHFLWCKFAP